MSKIIELADEIFFLEWREGPTAVFFTSRNSLFNILEIPVLILQVNPLGQTT